MEAEPAQSHEQVTEKNLPACGFTSCENREANMISIDAHFGPSYNSMAYGSPYHGARHDATNQYADCDRTANATLTAKTSGRLRPPALFLGILCSGMSPCGRETTPLLPRVARA